MCLVNGQIYYALGIDIKINNWCSTYTIVKTDSFNIL